MSEVLTWYFAINDVLDKESGTFHESLPLVGKNVVESMRHSIHGMPDNWEATSTKGPYQMLAFAKRNSVVMRAMCNEEERLRHVCYGGK